MITRENYEIYFIDFFENNLSKEDVDLLHVFLDKNEDLKDEFNEFDNIELMSEENENKEDFSFLKKSALINSLNEEDFFIGYIENDLSPEEKNELNMYLTDNPTSIAYLNLFKKTKLVPPYIIYTDKNDLKRHKIIPLYHYISSVAAAAVIFFIMMISFNNKENIFVSYYPREIKKQDLIIKNDIPIEEYKNKTVIADVSLAKNEISSNNNKREVLILDKIKETKIDIKNITQRELVAFESNEELSFKVLKEDDNILTPNVQILNETITLKQLVSRKITNTILKEEKDKITGKDLLASLGVNIVTTKKTVDYDVVEANKNTEKVIFKFGKIKISKKKR